MNITTYNEFCFILWYYTPIAYDLYLKGELTGTESKIGTNPLFYFSPEHIEKREHHWSMNTHGGILFNRTPQSFYEHQILSIDSWTPPPYKEHFKNDTLVFDKPILTIGNKCTIEWEKDLFNYFNIESLKMIFDAFYDDYKIIYIRPPHGHTNSFQHDDLTSTRDIGDIELIKESYPDIITIEDLLNKYPDKTYNELQMLSLANSDKHICCAGGEATIASYFGGDVLIYRHPTAPSHNRGVWHTDSYLKLFSGANIYGFNSYNGLIQKANELWK